MLHFDNFHASDTYLVTDLALQHGLEYCVQTQWWNSAGLLSEVVISNPVVVDLTPPVTGTLTATSPSGSPIRYQADHHVLCASWHTFDVNFSSLFAQWRDFESYVETYSCCASRNMQECDVNSTFLIHDKTDGCTVSTTAPMADGVVYYVLVMVSNRAGLVATASTNGVMIDSNAPQVDVSELVVGHGSSNQLFVNAHEASVFVSWPEWDVSRSHPSEQTAYTFAIALGDESCDSGILGFQNVGFDRQFLFTGLNLQHNWTYCVSLVAFGADRATASNNNVPFVVDVVPPDTSTAHIQVFRSLEEATTIYIRDDRNLTVTWDGVKDTTFVSYSLAVGTRPFGQHAAAWTDATSVNSVSLSNLTLQLGVEYFVTVIAYDAGGNEASFVSSPIIMDMSPPRMGQVFADPSLSVLTSETVTCTWYNAVDHESPISGYKVNLLKTRRGSSQVSALRSLQVHHENFADTPHTRQFDLQLINVLDDADVLLCEVVAINSAGWMQAARSAAVVVAVSGPRQGKLLVNFGTCTGPALCNSLSATWSGFSDAVGIHDFSVSVESSVGKVIYHQASIMTNQHIVLGQFTPNETYNLVLTANSKSGLSTQLSQGNLRCDDTVPDNLAQLSLSPTWGIVWPVFSESGRYTCECEAVEEEFVIEVSNQVVSSRCVKADKKTTFLQEGDIISTCDRGSLFDSEHAQCIPCPFGSFGVHIDGQRHCLPCASSEVLVHINSSSVQDNESGISNMKFAAGESLGQLGSVEGSNGTGAFSLVVPDSGLGTVFLSVRAMNSAGSVGTASFAYHSSMKELSFSGAVLDVLGDTLQQQRFVSQTSTAAIAWTNLLVPSHGNVYIRCAWGATPGSADFGSVSLPAMPAAGVESGTCVASTRLSVNETIKVYGTVIAASTAAAGVAIAYTDGFIVDTSPPKILAIRSGPNCGVGFFSTKAHISISVFHNEKFQFCWDVIEPDLPVAFTLVTLQPRSGPQISWNVTDNTIQIELEQTMNAELSTVTLQVFNSAGLSSELTFDLQVLPSAASWGEVLQVPVSDACFSPTSHLQRIQVSTSSASFVWPRDSNQISAFKQLTSQVKVSVGSMPGGSDILQMFALASFIPGALTSLHGLQLTNKADFYVSLNIEVNAAEWSVHSDSPIEVDVYDNSQIALSSLVLAADSIRESHLPTTEIELRSLKTIVQRNTTSACKENASRMHATTHHGATSSLSMSTTHVSDVNSLTAKVHLSSVVDSKWTTCIELVSLKEMRSGPLLSTQAAMVGSASQSGWFDDVLSPEAGRYGGDVHATDKPGWLGGIGFEHEDLAAPTYGQYDNDGEVPAYHQYNHYPGYEPDGVDPEQGGVRQCAQVTTKSNQHVKVFDLSTAVFGNFQTAGFLAVVVALTAPSGQTLREVHNLLRVQTIFESDSICGELDFASSFPRENSNSTSIAAAANVEIKLPQVAIEAAVEVVSAELTLKSIDSDGLNQVIYSIPVGISTFSDVSVRSVLLPLGQVSEQRSGTQVAAVLTLTDALQRTLILTSPIATVDSSPPTSEGSFVYFGSQPGIRVPWTVSSENTTIGANDATSTESVLIMADQSIRFDLASLSDFDSQVSELSVSVGSSSRGAQMSFMQMKTVSLHARPDLSNAHVEVQMDQASLHHGTVFYMFVTAVDVHMNSETWSAGPFEIEATPPHTLQRSHESFATIQCTDCTSNKNVDAMETFFVSAGAGMNMTWEISFPSISDPESGISSTHFDLTWITNSTESSAHFVWEGRYSNQQELQLGPLRIQLEPKTDPRPASSFNLISGLTTLPREAVVGWRMRVTGSMGFPGGLKLLARIKNGLGLSHTIIMPHVAFDPSPPVWPDTALYMSNGMSRVPACLAMGPGQSMSVFWKAAHDKESSVAAYAWSLGSLPGLADFLPKTQLGLSTSADCHIIDQISPVVDPSKQLVWPVGQAVYVSVFATNSAGSESMFVSRPIRALCDPMEASCKEQDQVLCLDVDD